jgi:hypothetical protein
MKKLSSVARMLWKHKTRFLFFFLGLCIQLIGLMIEYSDNLPQEYKFIAPSYFRAREGVKTLELTDKLSVGQVGYKEILPALVSYAQESMTAKGVTTFTGAKPDFTGVTIDGDLSYIRWLIFPQNQPPIFRVISFNLSRPGWDFSKVNPVYCPIDSFKEEVEKLKGSSVWMCGLLVFFLGSVVEFLALFQELPHSTKHANHRVEDFEI